MTVDAVIGMGPTWTNNRNESYNPTGLLRLLLTSLVHHSVWITLVCLAFPNARFHGLTLLDEHELIGELKNEHLTLEPTKQIPLATGVPPHIDDMIALKKVFDLCTTMYLKLDSHVINQKVEAKGGVKSVKLAKSLDQLNDELFRRIGAIGKYSWTPPPCEAFIHGLLLRVMSRGRDLFHSITRAPHGASPSRSHSLRT